MMVTVRSTRVADSEEATVEISAHPKPCVYCMQKIVWMRTYFAGRQLPFNAEPVPIGYDDGTGWVPGMFTVNGHLRPVLAPLSMHEPDKRARVANVMQVHKCPGRIGALQADAA